MSPATTVILLVGRVRSVHRAVVGQRNAVSGIARPLLRDRTSLGRQFTPYLPKERVLVSQQAPWMTRAKCVVSGGRS